MAEDLIISQNIYRANDETAFAVENLARYDLFIRIHPQNLAICAVDTQDNRCLLLESYEFEPTETDTALLVRLHNLWVRRPFLNAAFWHSIQVLTADRNFTMVPDEFTLGNNSYLQLTTPFSAETDLFFSSEIRSLSSSFEFYLSNNIVNWFRELYPIGSRLSFSHTTLSFLKGVLSFHKAADAGTFFVNIHYNLLSICCLDKGRVALLNTFPFFNTEELIYFILLAAKELRIPQKQLSVIIWGTIQENDAVVMALRRYVPEVSLGKRPLHLRFSYVFDEIAEHKAFDLLSAYILSHSAHE